MRKTLALIACATLTALGAATAVSATDVLRSSVG